MQSVQRSLLGQCKTNAHNICLLSLSSYISTVPFIVKKNCIGYIPKEVNFILNQLEHRATFICWGKKNGRENFSHKLPRLWLLRSRKRQKKAPIICLAGCWHVATSSNIGYNFYNKIMSSITTHVMSRFVKIWQNTEALGLIYVSIIISSKFSWQNHTADSSAH